jgi:hypothetical protein
MFSGQAAVVNTETKRAEVTEEARYEKWAQWPVHWSAIWVGASAAVAAVVVFGLIGIALELSLLAPEHRVVDLKKIGLGTLAFSVFASFLSFVIGGWVAGKIGGILHAERAMLHGAIAWLIAVPFLVVLAALGGSTFLGGWYAGLSGPPAWATTVAVPFDRPEPLGANATQDERAQYKAEQAEYNRKLKQWQDDTPKVTRNTALGVVTALLLGLVGSVIGGWMACGEPMTLTYHHHRPVTKSGRTERP